MEYQLLGNTGYHVSRLCFGALTLGPLATNLPLSKGAALLREAFMAGINFVDTAQYYRTYDYIAQALKGWQKELVIASKSYAETAQEMAYAVEEARIALQRDKIEIFLLHEQRDAATLKNNLPALEYLLEAKAMGLIGAVGISTHDVSAARMAAAMPEIDIIHALFNVRGLGIRGGSVTDMGQALARARALGKGIYTMKALGGGALIEEAQKSIAWAFAQKEAHAVALGMQDTAELYTNIAWMEGKKAPEEAVVKLRKRKLVFDKTPACSLCGACLKRCPQQALSFSEHGIVWVKERCLYCGYCIAACPWFCISFC
ncbi:MAG: aldo/keto reductase [Firmicutes bacterium]|nr:aldo/keto reductase [Bacillota bacterium]